MVATSELVVVGSVDEVTKRTEVVGLLSVVGEVVAEVLGTDEVEVIVGDSDEDSVDEVSVTGSGSVVRMVDV